MSARWTRRRFLQASLAAAVTVPSLAATGSVRPEATGKRPHVLMVVFDDLNDWVHCLGGYPGTVHTPYLDALAARGTLFTNAHCAIPLCNGSRTSTLTGLSPLQTGVFYNQTRWRDVPALQKQLTLPQYFRAQGYRTAGAGKIFHFHDAASWDSFWPDNAHGFPPEPVAPDNEHPRKGGPPQSRIDASFDWGVVPTPIEETPDYQVANRVIETIRQHSGPQPLFMGLGLGKPHLPWYLPQAYFDRYPLDSVQLPVVLQGDLDDVPAPARALVNDYLHNDIVKQGFWRRAVQAYLASMTFADAQLGRVLDALNASPLAEDTLVVVWSDHGWHLGEKLQWRKLTLWEEATRIPLIVSGPGSRPGQRCAAPVSLMDLLPTLGGLCRIPLPAGLPGHSLVPLLQDSEAVWNHVAPTVWEMDRQVHLAIRDRRYRYIRYADGSEELYDHTQDPHEWHNLAARPDMQAIRMQLAHAATAARQEMTRAIPAP